MAGVGGKSTGGGGVHYENSNCKEEIRPALFDVIQNRRLYASILFSSNEHFRHPRKQLVPNPKFQKIKFPNRQRVIETSIGCTLDEILEKTASPHPPTYHSPPTPHLTAPAPPQPKIRFSHFGPKINFFSVSSSTLYRHFTTHPPAPTPPALIYQTPLIETHPFSGVYLQDFIFLQSF